MVFYAFEARQCFVDVASTGLQVTKLSFNTAVVEKSGIAACFVGRLFQTDDFELNLCIMKTLRVLSTTGECRVAMSLLLVCH